MSRMTIVVGDLTSGGGRVITGSSFTAIDGKPVSRVNDQATCPKHKGVFPIVSGDATFIIDGQPVARHGDCLACGCTLISVSQIRVFVDAGTSDGLPADAAAAVASAASAATVGHESAFDLTFRIEDEATGKPLSGARYRITLDSGKVLEGTTDDEGMTEVIDSNSPELATIEVEPYAEKPTESSSATSCTDACGC